MNLVVAGVMLLGLPLLGVALSGDPIIRYLEFPPRTRYVTHAPFCWFAFAVFGGIIFLMPPVALP